jgi:hypothetical protein
MAGDVTTAAAWAELVRGIGEKRGATYEPVGGLNPRGGPAALCPGGTNRLTGQLAHEYWGASCDSDEEERGGRLFRHGEVLPGAVLAKAHMPDLAAVMPVFNVESLEGAADAVESRVSRHRVQFESIAFNQRFIATVPREYDPVALRETFSPGFLDWVAGIEADVDFGVSERQLYFNWRLRELTADEYEAALENAGQLFRRIRSEMVEHGIHTYESGPWHAGLEPFPADQTSGGT